jgi:hypothetical protein
MFFSFNKNMNTHKLAKLKSIFLVLGSWFLLQNSYSQVDVKVAFDSTAILVGDQINFNIQVVQERGAKVSYPQINDTLIGAIEILSTMPADTFLVNANTIRVTKKYLVTSFDSGDYKIDVLKFPFKLGARTDTAFSNVTMLYVRALPVKDPNKIADIKGVIEIPLTFKEVFPYIAFGILGLALIALIIYVIIRWKDKKTLFGLLDKPAEPAHVTAFRELEKLRTEKLWQQGLFKQYYSRLTDILRAYIENRLHIPAMESTSDEIIRDLHDNPLVDAKLISGLKEMLAVADLVKFAKSEPLPDENENAWQFTNDFVVKTMKDPVSEEQENTENAEEK